MRREEETGKKHPIIGPVKFLTEEKKETDTHVTEEEKHVQYGTVKRIQQSTCYPNQEAFLFFFCFIFFFTFSFFLLLLNIYLSPKIYYVSAYTRHVFTHLVRYLYYIVDTRKVCRQLRHRYKTIKKYVCTYETENRIKVSAFCFSILFIDTTRVKPIRGY